MKIFHRSKKSRGAAGIPTVVRINALRLLKLFENSREYLSLLDDGGDKAGGEYILDLHYVSSLVEKILERMNMIVHDACVLAPAGGEHLYRQLDRDTRLAGERFIEIERNRIADLEAAESTDDRPSEPEYVLLRQSLKWMTGRDAGREPSLKNLFLDVFEHVFINNPLTTASGASLPAVELNTSKSRNILRVVDLEAVREKTPESAVTVEELICRPLELMILGSGGGDQTGTSEVSPVREWLAVTSSDSLNLVATHPGGALQLAAKQGGDFDTDYIFVLSGKQADLGQIRASGLRGEVTAFGSIACLYEKPAEELEHCLSQLGHAFFSMNREGSST
jgi:hypothetical protein